MSRLKTLVFLSALSVFFAGAGALLGGLHGAAWGLGLACAVSFFSYWSADRVILSLHRAKEVRPADSFGIYEIVERLCEHARIPTPRICIIPDSSPNAFAVGRSPYHATVVVTQGLLGLLSYDELEGVLAHEVAHIERGDTLTGGVVALLASSILFFASASYWGFLFGQHSTEVPQPGGQQGAWGLFLTTVFAPPAALLVRLFVSRSREFDADKMGASLSGQPEWLASALRKIHNMNSGAAIARGNPAMAHLYVVNAFSASAVFQMFNTHPSVEERVQRLLQMKYGKYRSTQFVLKESP